MDRLLGILGTGRLLRSTPLLGLPALAGLGSWALCRSGLNLLPGRLLRPLLSRLWVLCRPGLRFRLSPLLGLLRPGPLCHI